MHPQLVTPGPRMRSSSELPETFKADNFVRTHGHVDMEDFYTRMGWRCIYSMDHHQAKIWTPRWTPELIIVWCQECSQVLESNVYSCPSQCSSRFGHSLADFAL